MEAIGDGTVTGKVITGGLAQSVSREGDVVRVRLTQMPGDAIPQTTYGPLTSLPLPEPVEVEAGKWVVVEMDWLPPAQREDVSQPVFIAQGMTVNSVQAGPSMIPGRTQATFTEGEADLTMFADTGWPR